MLGEKWKWKKYNQGGVKAPPVRPRKSQSQNNLTDSQEEDEIVVASNGSEGPGLDIASFHTSLLELFTDRPLDEKYLSILKMSNPRDVSRCLQLCLLWCKKELQLAGAEFPAPYGRESDIDTGISDEMYACDIRIFIYLLHRYIACSALPEPDSWDTSAKNVGFCAIRMLYTMSTVIALVALGTITSHEAHSFALMPSSGDHFDDVFDVARCGVGEMDRHGWEDGRLFSEFCNQFEAIIEDYATYGNEISSAVRNYITLNSPAQEVPEELGLTDGEDYHDDSWRIYDTERIYGQDDEDMFAV
ncbi:hypothetical protein F4803DRAFT_43859 [Xylaria telfairii]|nr:hypothetical protein F4803DRAFT_43859 [Xylaria telfairii]